MREALVGLATQYYRKTKTYMLTRQPPVLTPLFFHAVEILDKVLSPRRQSARGQRVNQLWKQQYFAFWAANQALRLKVKSDYPVAHGSDDHRYPRGTVFDNSVNYGFNLKLYETLGFPERIAVMDLGCAGGGMVRSFLEDGHFAIGLEGSDTSQRLRSGEWDTIPFHLFTCDITKPFLVTDWHDRAFLFDAITAWEVLEHIPEEAIDGLIGNIHRHLKTNGYFIGSVDLLPDGNPLTGAVYHRTLKPAQWWLAQFTTRGFIEVKSHGFTRRDMVRGNGLSLKDWRPEDGGGIHLVLQKL